MWREKNSAVGRRGKEPQTFLQCLNLILHQGRPCWVLPVGSMSIFFTKTVFFIVYFLKALFERDTVRFISF